MEAAVASRCSTTRPKEEFDVAATSQDGVGDSMTRLLSNAHGTV